MSHFIVAQADKCIGCHTCEVACAVVHAGSPAQAALRYFPRLRVTKLQRISVPVMCRQCENAPCVAACPVAALYQSDSGVLAINERCIDCKSCVIACPFGSIEIVSQPEATPQIVKCDLCSEHPTGPACVSVCPTEALAVISLEELSNQQQRKQRWTAENSQLKGPLLAEISTHG